MRNLYRYVKLYSSADPIFDEEDIFRLTVPLNADHSPEKVAIGPEKVVIGPEKVAIGPEKVAIDIDELQRYLNGLNLTQPTQKNVLFLFKKLGNGIFGRAQIMAYLEISSSGAGKLLNTMLHLGLLKSVKGQGKGRYQFSLNAVLEKIRVEYR